MTSLYTHLFWFSSLFTLLFFSFILSLYVSLLNTSLYLSFNLFSFIDFPLSFSLYFDYMSSWFFTAVTLISTIVSVYAYFYIAPYSNSIYFMWATILFVLSMLLVISVSNLFFLMLGWDGLGLVSFFLIVYYQNQSSITSGLFTLLINRIGDCFFLVSIASFMYFYNDLFSNSSVLLPSFTVFLLLFTFMTNSAIYPFSPWLPLAMAAPTPISALVHSSTLVTAGLYLIMRFSPIFYSSYSSMNLLLILSVFTSFYAGLNTIFENDLKKLIALSTLSHLGFIGIAFSSGLLVLAFFHIMTHALFKSLLFITIGDIIINLNHSQDIRYLSQGINYTPFSCYVIYVSLLNLLGVPMLSGFFSKDLVLEMLNFSHISSLLFLIVFFNVAFTYYYSYQLFYYSFSSSKLNPYQLFHSPIVLHSFLMFSLSLFSLSFGFFYISMIYNSIIFVSLSFILKFLPVFINLLFILHLFLNTKLFTYGGNLVNYYFSNMIFLSNFISFVMSKSYFTFLFYFVNTTEIGLMNYSVNSSLSQSYFNVAQVTLLQASRSPINLVLLTLLLVTLFFLLDSINHYWRLLLVGFLWNLT